MVSNSSDTVSSDMVSSDMVSSDMVSSDMVFSPHLQCHVNKCVEEELREQV